MRFIETIGVKNGFCELLSYHQARMDYTYQHFYNSPNPHILEELIQTIPESGFYKFRLVYDKDIQEITSSEYSIRPILSLEVIESDLDYSFKYENRKELDVLFSSKNTADDILISRNGLITDTYYANVAFLEGNIWKTPKQPLLKGTRRQKLIDQELVEEADIHSKDLNRFSKIRLFNAMIQFGQLELPISAIKMITV